jgi:hypothetical protein
MAASQISVWGVPIVHMSPNRPALKERIGGLDWSEISRLLDNEGFAELPPILSPAECSELSRLYEVRARFRSRIEMARFGFGIGEYKYFATPLPSIVTQLRESLYPRVESLANEWMKAMRLEASFPLSLDEFLAHCHCHGQTKPTPLLLKYEAGGYNCLHQDLYGAIAFPLQFTFMLSRWPEDYTGGEFLLLQQRPRAQSRGQTIIMKQGAGIVFATRYRPVKGSRGFYRVNVKHGISQIRTGSRYALGIIFHDAR